jgi:hypothetical protein
MTARFHTFYAHELKPSAAALLQAVAIAGGVVDDLAAAWDKTEAGSDAERAAYAAVEDRLADEVFQSLLERCAR